MRGAELDHILMHLHSVKTEVEELMKSTNPRTRDRETCKKFLAGLKDVHDTTLRFRVEAGSLGLRKPA